MKLNDAGIYNMHDIFKGDVRDDNKTVVLSSIPRVINIPAYQRPYRWKPENINQLFDDYYDYATKEKEDNEQKYFVGSSVIVEKEQSGTEELIFDVVDGQQRITTLYLLNYIRYLLIREYIIGFVENPNRLVARKDSIYHLKDCYVGLIGKDKKGIFNKLCSELEKVVTEVDEENDPSDAVQNFKNSFFKLLGIEQNKQTPEETEAAIKKATKIFLDSDDLCLSYSRDRYINTLKEAMSKVYIKTKNGTCYYELKIIDNSSDSNKVGFSENYTEAMKTIFEKLWDIIKNEHPGETDSAKLCQYAIKLADKIVKDLTLCIIMTSNYEDAYKLFEVLNDRSMEVTDLELIKNLFYQYYCLNSDDDEERIDNNIIKLDELWTDNIFENTLNSETSSRFISYLAAEFLTKKGSLVFKDDTKFKNAIKKDYLEKNKGHYTYEDILSAFNVYLAVKVILDKYNIKYTKSKQNSLEAEADTNKSISYKTLHLLYARGYHAVIPALTNVIIATYCQSHTLSDDNFEDDFNDFIDKVLDDSHHTNENYSAIHKCAYYLWRAALMAKDYDIPKQIAYEIIEKNGLGSYDRSVSFDNTLFEKAKKELPDWIDDWTYSSNSTFVPKVLMLNLLAYEKDDHNVLGYRGFPPTLPFAARKLELDHLEARAMVQGNEKQYYSYDDKEKRKRDVNNYLGNFMILDNTNNNWKKMFLLKVHSISMEILRVLGYIKKSKT